MYVCMYVCMYIYIYIEREREDDERYHQALPQGAAQQVC